MGRWASFTPMTVPDRQITAADRRRLGAQLASWSAPGVVWSRLTAAALVLQGGLGIAVALVLAPVMAAAIQGAPVEAAPVLIALAVCLAGRAVLAGVAEWCGARASAAVRRAVRRAVVDKMARLGPARLENSRTGALVSLAVEQVEALDGYAARYRPQVIAVAAVPPAVAAVALWIDWRVGLALLISAPLVPLAMALVGLGAAAASQRQFTEMARMNGHFLDRLQGLWTLKLFDMADPEADRIAQVADRFRAGTMRVLRIAFLSSTALEVIASGAIAALAVYLVHGWLTGGGGVDLAGGLVLLMLVPEFYLPFRQFAASYHDRASAIGAADHIAALLDRPDPPAAGTLAPPAAAPQIAFAGVGVARGGRSDGVTAVELTLLPGQTTAVVGASGAGKSTLIDVVLGLLEPTEGRLLIDGIPLSGLDRAAWRRQIAWLGQSPALIHGTVRDNIVLGRPDASADAVAEAVEMAGLTPTLATLPKGLDTALGEGGSGVSGGEARRIALARAILTDAPVVLLDEPTASLDAATEATVIDGLRRFLPGRTALLATHAEAPLALAHRVVTLDRGRIGAAKDAARAANAPVPQPQPAGADA